MTEDKLVRQLREGRRDALHHAIDRYTPYVSAVAFRAIRGQCCREDLEEIVSDTFLSLWTHAGELREGAGLLPYLAAVARNKALDRLRKAAPSCPLDAEPPDAGPSPEERLLRKEEAELLYRTVSAMEEPDRSLFLRYYYDEEPLDVIAKDLGMKRSTAKTRLFRGRKKLKEILNKGGFGDDTTPA